MSHISSYSKVFAVGHKWVLDIFDDPVIVQEKVDGSQISFGVIDGELSIRSSGATIYIESAPKMFNKAIATILELKDELKPGLIYRGEYLSKPKHNTLAYDRVPKKNIIIFDIATEGQNYLPDLAVAIEAERLGLEIVPLLFCGVVKGVDQLKTLLDRVSILGGQKIEGVVIKNYEKFTDDKKTMMAKYVNPEFQEKHQRSWRKENPTRGDVINNIISEYQTEARWQKAVQHLREGGQLKQSPQDIGNLIKAVKEDVKSECEEEIKQKLFDRFWGEISRRVAAGLPEWYKEKLAREAFE